MEQVIECPCGTVLRAADLSAVIGDSAGSRQGRARHGADRDAGVGDGPPGLNAEGGR